jgi:predicted TIM-barrel fold metal-dependent hydrolase
MSRHCSSWLHGRHNLSRRRFLGSLTALGVGTSLDARAVLLGQSASPAATSRLHRIVDVHHHFYPPFFLEAWLKAPPAGEPPIPVPVQQWTVARTVEQLDQNSVATALLSTSIRVAALGATIEDSRTIVRRYNDYAMQMMQNHPGRFGLFGILPMPDVEGSLREIEYALDVLKADGINLFTNYGDRWLGHPQFVPVLEELNRRAAIAYVHPVTPGCCGNLLKYVSDAVIEYPHDTTRAIVDLLLSGTFARYRHIRWIFSHGGGTLPMLAGRIRTLAQREVRNLSEVAPDGVDAEFKKLFFEIANAAWPASMAALLSYMPVGQLLFGTDFPFLTLGQNLQELRAANLPVPQLQLIEGGNAGMLIPRLRG